MNKETIQKFLEQASQAYYNGTPIIPDDVYDALESKVTATLGYRGEDAAHLYKLYSLEKYYPMEGEQCTRLFKTPVKTVKLDGACIAASYVSGKLVSVITRGDGEKGKDITDKFTYGKFFPTSISTNMPTQIVLEVVAPKEIQNARNYAAGALNLKDLQEFNSRNLFCVVHGVQPSITGSYREDMKYLHDVGFWTVLDKSDWSEFPSDGLVVREDAYKAFEEWGYTNHHPRGAYAEKERKEGVQTILRSVVWQVGKSGKVTPVGLFDPIDIDGAMVSKASLHNIAFIESLELDIGDKIEVVRSGEIIPYILGKVE